MTKTLTTEAASLIVVDRRWKDEDLTKPATEDVMDQISDILADLITEEQWDHIFDNDLEDSITIEIDEITLADETWINGTNSVLELLVEFDVTIPVAC